MYMTNGSFIAAALLSGFSIKWQEGNPNVCFNMCRKSLNSKEHDQYNKCGSRHESEIHIMREAGIPIRVSDFYPVYTPAADRIS